MIGVHVQRVVVTARTPGDQKRPCEFTVIGVFGVFITKNQKIPFHRFINPRLSQHVQYSMDFPWTATPEEVLHHFSVDPTAGLSSHQVSLHSEHYGTNGACIRHVLSPAPH
jgi:hypothetical protein